MKMDTKLYRLFMAQEEGPCWYVRETARGIQWGKIQGYNTHDYYGHEATEQEALQAIVNEIDEEETEITQLLEWEL